MALLIRLSSPNELRAEIRKQRAERQRAESRELASRAETTNREQRAKRRKQKAENRELEEPQRLHSQSDLLVRFVGPTVQASG